MSLEQKKQLKFYSNFVLNGFSEPYQAILDNRGKRSTPLTFGQRCENLVLASVFSPYMPVCTMMELYSVKISSRLDKFEAIYESDSCVRVLYKMVCNAVFLFTFSRNQKFSSSVFFFLSAESFLLSAPSLVK